MSILKTPEQIEKRKEYMKAYMRAYMKNYYATHPEYKQKVLAYHKTEKVRAYNKIYQKKYQERKRMEKMLEQNKVVLLSQENNGNIQSNQ